MWTTIDNNKVIHYTKGFYNNYKILCGINRSSADLYGRYPESIATCEACLLVYFEERSREDVQTF